jgi:hypothetical protein
MSSVDVHVEQEPLVFDRPTRELAFDTRVRQERVTLVPDGAAHNDAPAAAPRPRAAAAEVDKARRLPTRVEKPQNPLARPRPSRVATAEGAEPSSRDQAAPLRTDRSTLLPQPLPRPAADYRDAMATKAYAPKAVAGLRKLLRR